jgi:hypothetical protein
MLIVLALQILNVSFSHEWIMKFRFFCVLVKLNYDILFSEIDMLNITAQTELINSKANKCLAFFQFSFMILTSPNV